MPLTLPNLPYALNALEPHIDAKTMEIHSQKHHKAYVDNANKAIDGTPFANWTAEELITKLAELPEDKRGPVAACLVALRAAQRNLAWVAVRPRARAPEGGAGNSLPGSGRQRPS